MLQNVNPNGKLFIYPFFINYDKFRDDFDFFLIHYSLAYKVFDRLSFIWTVNDKFIYDVVKNKGLFIITDKAYLLH